jgi:hypothetical protein
VLLDQEYILKTELIRFPDVSCVDIKEKSQDEFNGFTLNKKIDEIEKKSMKKFGDGKRGL